MKFTVVELVVVLAIMVILLCLLDGPFDLPVWVLAGWLFFLQRVGPQIVPDWGSVATAVVCLAGLIVGLQWFLGWLYAHPGQDGAPARRWQFRWTMMILSVVVLLFVAGISFVGATHQIAWLFTSPEGILTSSRSDPGRRMMSRNHLKQIGVALHSYADEHGTLPPGGTFDAHGRAMHGWQTLLLPYVEQDAVFKQIQLHRPWSDPGNAPALRTFVSTYGNPGVRGDAFSPDGYALSHYAGNARLLGGPPGLAFNQITDGTSNTLLAGEVNARFKPWGHPTNWRDPALGINRSPDGFGGPWSTRTVFLMADGSVRTISNDASPELLRALSTPASGDVVPEFYD